MKIIAASFMLVALLVAISSSTAAGSSCWKDPDTGYLCCPHPWGGIYCDPATGPD